MQPLSYAEASRWSQWHRSLWRLIFVGLLTLSAFRFGLLYLQGPALGTLPTHDLEKAFWVGLRFDLKYLAIFLGPLIVLSLFFYQASERWWSGFYRLSVGYVFVFLLAVNLLGIVNYYYFSFYQSPINALVFGLAEDDTRAVFSTLWSDFPVLQLLIFVFALSTAQTYVAFKRGQRLRTPPTSRAVLFTVIACSVLSLVFLSRGSLGKFPLRAMHMSVSSNTFINQLVPSGLHALFLAQKERKNNDLGKNPNLRLSQFGFADWQEAAAVCTGQSVTDYTALQQISKVNAAVEQKSPHVVLAVMEAWGRHLMAFDDPKTNDLLGELRPWVEQKADYFPQALSAQNGTHPSLEGILFDTPITPLTQSRYGYVSYDTSRVLPYKKAGYRTVFLTAGPGSWRQLQEALLRQGFDEVHDDQAILKAYPQATTHTWGVDDEWMFNYATDLLKAADEQGEKVMLMMLSVTNHPPYRIPAHYKPLPLDEKKLGTEMAVDAKMGRSILETYQYANNALGHFLQDLEDRNLLSHTVFAASGDHNTRSIFSYPDSSELPYKFGVPILFFIPEAYKLSTEKVNTAVWSAHNDIFPTLWAHSLSAVELPLSSGHNVYSMNPAQAVASSFIGADGGDVGVALSVAGGVTNLALPKYYAWIDASMLSLRPLESPTPELVALHERERACLALKDWRIRHQALGLSLQ